MNILVRSDNVEKFSTLTIPYITYRDDDGEEQFLMFQKLEEIPEEFRDKAKQLKAKMKIPDFETNNTIFCESTLYRPDGIAYTNLALYKRHTLKRLLKSITIDEQVCEIDEKNYGHIDPNIADHIYQAFNDKYLNPTLSFEELRKKIVSEVK